MSSPELLDEVSVLELLADRGLLDVAGASARVLSGGVSNTVLAIDDSFGHMVAKQSLPRLRVSGEWRAPVERVFAEADALLLCRRLTPHRVPGVLEIIPEHHAIVIEHAPLDWVDWKTRLLGGEVEPGVGGWVGEALAQWHSSTASADLGRRLEDPSGFEELRIDPYLRELARRRPEHAAALAALIAEVLERRECLVHGDLSPKNVLAGPGLNGWVIDFEVAHRGDPAFDVAFMLTHLQMKAVHMPRLAAAIDECAGAFVAAYERGHACDWPHALALTGALLLARVEGKSPAEYLTGPEKEIVWRLGESLLGGSPADPVDLPARRERAQLA